MRRLAPIIAGLILFFAIAQEANAEIPPLLRRSTRRMWAGGGLGAAAWVESYGGSGLKLVQFFGFHFNKSGHGPAIAVELGENFGGGSVGLQIVPQFQWNIPLVTGLGLYLAPIGGAGVVIAGGSAAFDLQLACEAKLILGDRGMVFLRPLSFDILIGGYGGYTAATTFYNFLLGGGVVF